jgi:hypothetical protein
MSDLQKVGPDWGGAGTFKPFTSGISGGQRVNDAHGRYLDAVLGNRMFFLSFSAATASAYTGTAAGTPLVAVHNPANSGKFIVAAAVGFALRNQSSGAGQLSLNIWTGPSVSPTGTRTNPTSVLSQTASGSSSLGFVNVALTGSTALNLALPIFTHYWATAASAMSVPGLFDIAGLIVAAPGNQIALGATTVLTSLTLDGALYWEEIPYLPQV